MDFTVQDLAEALFTPNATSFEDSGRLNEQISKIVILPRDRHKAFMNEFASLHLPRFLFFIRVNWSTLAIKSALGSFFVDLKETYALAKWVRESDYSASVQFGREVMGWLATSCTFKDTDFSIPLSSDAEFWIALVGRAGDLLLNILRNVPRPSGLASASALLSSFENPTLAKSLYTLLTMLDKRPNAVDKDHEAFNRSMISFVFNLANDFTKDHDSKLLDEYSQSSYWAACEAKTKDAGSRCTKLPVGEELSACGSCYLVRYCSRDHQRADWKQHKKSCFKTTWEVKEAL